tara:strand:+ start:248 stop:2422 length:2175 start_codon:yes stop_codon:yes gene_type:complete
MNDDDLVTQVPAQPADGASDQFGEEGIAQPVEGVLDQPLPTPGPGGGPEGPPPGEEPAWEEPSFDEVSISSVVFAGSKYWDRALYKLSNGKTAFASKGLDVGDIPFDYEEIRTSGGGFFSAPSGVVGHTFTRNGGALIIKQGESFLQQQYVWGNQGPVMSPNTSDVSKQIGSIEEREDEDMNGDGFVGTPEEEEVDVEVSSIVYDNPKSNFDRSIYRMSDGTVQLAEHGLTIGDLPYESEELKSKNGSPIEIAGIVGALWIKDGFGIIYNNDGVVSQQSFKWGNRGPRTSGKLRDVTKQVDKIEDREDIDINGDGFIGGQDEEVEISSIVYDNLDSTFDRSIYTMTDGTVLLAEQGLSSGDLPYEGEQLTDKKGSPIETKGVVGVLGLRNGFGIIYNDSGIVNQQAFKWGNRGPRVSGKLRDVTKQVDKIEEREGLDMDGDGLIGDQSPEDAEVQFVIIQASRDEGFDRSLYKLTDGSVILGERGLVPGDLPLDSDPLLNSDGSFYSADNAIGLIGMRRGLALLLQKEEEYVMQQFSWEGRFPKAKGKERIVTKRIHSFEDKEGQDFTGDGIIGEPYSGQDPEVSRVIFLGSDEFDSGLYQMNNGDLVFAETDLEPGDTPFEDDIIYGKNRQPYPGKNVVGIYPIKKGFALVEIIDGAYFQQGFLEGNGSPRLFGKQREVRNIAKIEQRIGYDINNDGLIAEGSYDEFAVGNGDLNQNEQPLQL